MLHQTWIILIVLHHIGGSGSQSVKAPPQVKDAKQIEPIAPKRVMSVMVPIDTGEGQEKQGTKGIRYNIPGEEVSGSGDLYSHVEGGIGPLEQSLPERTDSDLNGPVHGEQIRITRHPIANIQPGAAAIGDDMSESEEDRLELLIRSLPADQDLGAIAQRLREDKTVDDEITPNLPGYRVVKPATQDQITQVSEVVNSVHELPPNKSIEPIAIHPPEGKQAGESTRALPQNKALQDQPTETTELEGPEGVSQEEGRNNQDATTTTPLVPTLGTTLMPDRAESLRENSSAAQDPAILNQNMTTDTHQRANSTTPVQQRNPNDENREPSNKQDAVNNADARMINQRENEDGTNEEGGKNRPEGKHLEVVVTEPMLRNQMNPFAAVHASIPQRQVPGYANGNGQFVVLGNQRGSPPASNWYFNSGYGYGGVNAATVPQVHHQVVPRQVYGGVPHAVYGTVPVGGHGGRYAGGYTLGNRPSPVQIPHIDRNGCTEPGDVTCSNDVNQLCTYQVCVLANENKNLWRRPLMRVVDTPCPVDRGVVSEFCNPHERLLRAIGLIKDEDGNRAQRHHHQKTYAMAKDPCILFNDACTGVLV